MHKQIKENKYLIFGVVIMGLVGLILMMNVTLGERLLTFTNEEALKLRDDYLITSEESLDSTEESLVEEDINREKVVNEATYPNGNGIDTGRNIDTEDSEENEETTKTDLNAVITDQYIVEANDTLFLIAQRANVSVENLKTINQLTGDVIVTGQVLSINSKVDNITTNIKNEVASRGDREDDLYWLSRIIHAEAQGEPYEGKVAVGNVVLNRVKSDLFPNTVHGVVFDKQYGYTQFSPVIDGSIYNAPNADSIKAAKEALNGAKPVGDVLYFLNPRKATNFWILANREFYTTIGDHDFYH